MIFVEDADESAILKSATKSNAPRAPRSGQKDKLRLQKNQAHKVSDSCVKLTPTLTCTTPTLDGQPNRLYISSPMCSTPTQNIKPMPRTPIAVHKKPEGDEPKMIKCGDYLCVVAP